MKTRILIKEGEYRLAKAHVMNPKVDAEELYSFLTGVDRVAIFMNANKEVDSETEEQYFGLIDKRATRIPLQHIIGHQSFMGYDFKVNEHVLIPRQDTETLVTEAARIIHNNPKQKPSFWQRLKGAKGWEVLDLCCGSGCIGISLDKICSEIKVTASDISNEALEVARGNADELRADIEFVQGDLFGAVNGRKFDMIVSNPPYIKTTTIQILQEEVKNHEPMNALDGGKDGLDYYRIIVSEAEQHLKPNGYLIMEIGHDQGTDLSEMIADTGKYTPAEIIKDLPGRDRVVKCQLR